ncbi:hypothetical protein [Nocardioides sp. Root151]|uniref:hypothetical protein n=1 Tax=Nocardioides sp. Root151 TaxID=1736475 RepID=UPI000703494D|nr:hypothetical protein [Nocardioides sp. Root151]KQZ66412.1 hypothetical protein ASD66_23055 [Nocardioides sp. Root151]
MIVIPGSVVRRTAALALVGMVALAPAASADPGDPVDLGGTPVGTSTDDRKPTVVEAGLWSTKFEPGEAFVHELAYERTARFTSVHTSVTATPLSSGESIKLEAFGLNGTSCGSETASADYAAPFTAIGVDLEVGPDGATDLNSDCLRADRLRFTVGPSSTTRESKTELPMTIKVVEESPLKDADTAVDTLPAPPETEASFRAPADGDDRGTVEGATSFDEAPLLNSGTYDSTVTEGEQRLYRVHLEWGQTLAAALHVDALSESDLEQKFGISGPTVYLGVYNPMRRDLDSAYSDSDVEGSVDDTALDLDTGVGPVRYLNRYDDQNTYLPGDYYVSVVVPEETASERGPAEIEFALTVEAQGDIAGAPTYAEDQPFLVGDGKRSEVASGNPAPEPDGAGWLSARHVSGLGIGLAGLVCLALGALRLRRP